MPHMYKTYQLCYNHRLLFNLLIDLLNIRWEINDFLAITIPFQFSIVQILDIWEIIIQYNSIHNI